MVSLGHSELCAELFWKNIGGGGGGGGVCGVFVVSILEKKLYVVMRFYCIMMTLWHRNTFHITCLWLVNLVDSLLKGPVIQSFDAFGVVELTKLLNKWWSCRWFEMPRCSCDITVMDLSVDHGYYISGLMHERHNSIANALSYWLSCTYLSIWQMWYVLAICFALLTYF